MRCYYWVNGRVLELVHFSVILHESIITSNKNEKDSCKSACFAGLLKRLEEKESSMILRHRLVFFFFFPFYGFTCGIGKFN